MAILSLGISHRRAGVDLLERLAFGEDDLAKAYRAVADDGAIEGAVVVSTCNRVEVYGDVASYHAGFLALKRLLADTRSVDPGEFAEALYSHFEDAATEHLFDVASGLDSMVLGEPQILSQVRSAHRLAEAEGASTPALAALFHAAARAGRCVRDETAIGAAPDAFVEAGTDLAEEWLGGLEGRRAVVVGAGQMSGLAVKHLSARGIGSLQVLNRSVERARVLADRTGAAHGGLDRLGASMAEADLVVSATGSSAALIGTDAVAGRVNDGRRLFVLDLAVPRDVDPAVGDLDGVRLVDVDRLRERFERREAATAAELDRAHAIVVDEVRRFAIRRRSERLAPLITSLRARGEEVAVAELRRFRTELNGLTDDERAAVEALARGIVAKLLHDPVVRLKERAAPGADAGYANVVAELFGIELPERPTS